MYDAVILGAGASGMVCAIKLARQGAKVVIIERQSRGGKKILASGNGHCNIANANVSAKNFYAKNQQLIKSVLSYKAQDIVEFFNTLGLEITAKEDGKMYPKSMQASSVLELLEAEIKRLKIECLYDVKDLKISAKKETEGFSFALFGAKASDSKNSSIKAKNLIIATGSPAAPQLGGNSSGLELAKSFGHTILEPLPSLVPLISSAKICKILAGVKVKAKVRLFAEQKEIASQVGDFLFTKYGVSGLSILDLSLKAAMALKAKKSCYILVDFFSQLNKQELAEYLKSKIDKKRNLPLSLWFSGFMNSKLSYELLKELKLDTLNEANLNSKNLKELIQHFKNYKIEIEGTREFKYAEVAYGGVNSSEVDSKTLQSKKQKGLYFIGEVLDVVGDRGGYNFYFAWSSAFVLAKSISSRFLQDKI